MATIFELTGNEREERITDLKQKMLAAYAKNKAAHDAGEAVAHAAPVAVAVAEEEEAPVAMAVADSMLDTVTAPTGNGAVVVAPKPVAAPKAPPRPAAPKPAKAEEVVVPALSSADMTRRE